MGSFRMIVRSEGLPIALVVAAWLVLVSIFAFFGGWMFQFSIHFWLAYSGHPAQIPFIVCIIGAFVTSPVLLPVWFVTLILSYVLV